MPEYPPAVSFSEERAELEALLASGVFTRAPTRAQILIYVCQKYFEGNAGQIKEYNIAVEALGRPADFDQETDAIVRVEAHRLRKRLKEYYAGEGARHYIQITIPPGAYVPHFTRAGESGESLAVIPVAPPAVTYPVPPRPGVMRRYVILAAALALSLLLLAVLTFHATQNVARAPRIGSWPADGDETRILVGAPEGRYVDRLGHLWLGDRFFTGGVAVENPAQGVGRTPDPALYQARREGEFRYDVPLKAGVYELRLYFAETVYGAGKPKAGGESSRVFTVTVNGQPRLSGFDIASDAYGSDIADIKVFKDVSPDRDGVLRLHFKGDRGGLALLNAIEILAALPGRIAPIRVVAQESMLGDRQGRVWFGDRFFQGGQTATRLVLVRNAPEPAIYRGERYGNFTYTMPVASGRYAVTLHFAESYFGTGKPGGGGVGSRVFDIYCNGVALLKNFDIYKAAGAADVAVRRTFSGLEPNAQGKLVLSFVPVRNYACVNAIEVE